MIVAITPMKRRHLRSVLANERVAYPSPWSRAMYLSELAMRGTRAYIVACVEGDVVGHAGVIMNGTMGHITTIVVDEVHRRRGVATRLLAQLTAEILQRGGSEATLEVRESNEAAQMLYARFGFERVGRRKNYYPESREDAIIMTVTDLAADGYKSRIRALAASVPGSTRVEMAPPW